MGDTRRRAKRVRELFRTTRFVETVRTGCNTSRPTVVERLLQMSGFLQPKLFNDHGAVGISPRKLPASLDRGLKDTTGVPVGHCNATANGWRKPVFAVVRQEFKARYAFTHGGAVACFSVMLLVPLETRLPNAGILILIENLGNGEQGGAGLEVSYLYISA